MTMPPDAYPRTVFAEFEQLAPDTPLADSRVIATLHVGARDLAERASIHWADDVDDLGPCKVAIVHLPVRDVAFGLESRADSPHTAVYGDESANALDDLLAALHVRHTEVFDRADVRRLAAEEATRAKRVRRSVSRRLVQSSASRMPEEVRERYELEWLAELRAIRSRLGALLFALSLRLSVKRIHRALALVDREERSQPADLALLLAEATWDSLGKVFVLSTTVVATAGVASSFAVGRWVAAAAIGGVAGVLLMLDRVLVRPRRRKRDRDSESRSLVR
jgi:hypothetical protein